MTDWLAISLSRFLECQNCNILVVTQALMHCLICTFACFTTITYDIPSYQIYLLVTGIHSCYLHSLHLWYIRHLLGYFLWCWKNISDVTPNCTVVWQNSSITSLPLENLYSCWMYLCMPLHLVSYYVLLSYCCIHCTIDMYISWIVHYLKHHCHWLYYMSPVMVSQSSGCSCLILYKRSLLYNSLHTIYILKSISTCNKFHLWCMCYLWWCTVICLHKGNFTIFVYKVKVCTILWYLHISMYHYQCQLIYWFVYSEWLWMI